MWRIKHRRKRGAAASKALAKRQRIKGKTSWHQQSGVSNRGVNHERHHGNRAIGVMEKYGGIMAHGAITIKRKTMAAAQRSGGEAKRSCAATMAWQNGVNIMWRQHQR